ncbi:hypothetical protein BpHYR1_010466 [Brachionus plicatilis]|uniref:Uncharacterized protein n=1 Tax=Brachionus plicatilis TaxID=10195 RepID=A0A3M7T0W1_BRAPC|nr:hypothetical protein BpHYR1_010466 [Brachionus plicatilis]
MQNIKKNIRTTESKISEIHHIGCLAHLLNLICLLKLVNMRLKNKMKQLAILNETENSIMQNFSDLPFSDATTELSGVNYPTISIVIPILLSLRNKLLETNNESLFSTTFKKYLHYYTDSYLNKQKKEYINIAKAHIRKLVGYFPLELKNKLNVNELSNLNRLSRPNNSSNILISPSLEDKRLQYFDFTSDYETKKSYSKLRILSL